MKLMGKIRKAWKTAPIATAVLGVALAIALFFAIRLTMFWVYWNNPANRDQQIADWMTPGYIALSWSVPREVVMDALPTPEVKRRRNFRQMSDDSGVPVDELMGRAQQAIEAFRADHPRKDQRP